MIFEVISVISMFWKASVPPLNFTNVKFITLSLAVSTPKHFLNYKHKQGVSPKRIHFRKPVAYLGDL